VQVEILVDALHDGGLQAGDLVNFVQKIVQLACRWESGRLTVEVGWPDQERLLEVFRSTQIPSQHNDKVRKDGSSLDGVRFTHLTRINRTLFFFNEYFKQKSLAVGQPADAPRI
jgi:hypothetical protein